LFGEIARFALDYTTILSLASAVRPYSLAFFLRVAARNLL